MKDDIKVLIVEDEVFTSMMICEHLKSNGFNAVSVSTGESAIQKTDEINPDIIFMDIRLAGFMNGIESAMKILSRYEIPIVFMTGYSSEELIEETKQLKIAGFLTKPLLVENIDSMILSILDKPSTL